MIMNYSFNYNGQLNPQMYSFLGQLGNIYAGNVSYVDAQNLFDYNFKPSMMQQMFLMSNPVIKRPHTSIFTPFPHCNMDDIYEYEDSKIFEKKSFEEMLNEMPSGLKSFKFKMPFATDVSQKPSKNHLPANNNAFNLAMDFVFEAEGGFVDDSNDSGGKTNMGITQRTFDAYREKNALSSKDVKDITKAEAQKIYYDEYWIKSGADKISDSKMAILVVDSAIQHGPARAKEFYNKSNNDIDKFIDLRLRYYDDIIAKDPNKAKYRDGWNNRINNIKAYIDKIG